MKRFYMTLLLSAIIAAGGTGCATGYWIDRGRDAADVFTLTVGWGWGAKARVSSLDVGLVFVEDGVGLRGGKFYDGGFALDVYPWHHEDICLLVLGQEKYESESSSPDLREKDYCSMTAFGLPTDGFLFGSSHFNPAYWTQIEAVVALGPSVRVGFNPGELVDLLLGFVGLDLYGDDIESLPTLEELAALGSDP